MFGFISAQGDLSNGQTWFYLVLTVAVNAIVAAVYAAAITGAIITVL